MKGFLLRLLTVLLFPLSLCIAWFYAMFGLLVSSVVWLATGDGRLFYWFFKNGPERFLIWPLYRGRGERND